MIRHLHSSGSSDDSSDNGLSQNDVTPATEAASCPIQLPDLALEILNSSDDCTKVLDLDGQILFMSRRGQALLNIQDITPFLNTAWADFWQGPDRQAALAAIAKARTGEVCTFQGYCPTLSGEPKWWDSKVSPIRGANGNVERLLCISRDITDRKRAEDDRKHAEQERDRFLAVGSDLQVITGNDGYFRWVSPTFERLLGWTTAEMTSRPWTEFVHPDDVPGFELETASLFSGNETFEFENRYRHKDGSYRWLLWNAQSYPAEQIIYGAAVDITERKQAEIALRESEARFRLMADAVPQIVWITDAEGRVEFSTSNGAITRAFPMSRRSQPR